MATAVDVCNKALGRIGVTRITSLSDTSAAGLAVAASFSGASDWVLSNWAWSFAVRRETLYYATEVAAGGTATGGWVYALPGDFLGLVPDLTGTFELEADGVVSAQAPPLEIRYVARIDAVRDWPVLFCDAVAWRLAIEVQPELAPTFLHTQLDAGLALAVRAARRLGAIEKKAGVQGDNVWVLSK